MGFVALLLIFVVLVCRFDASYFDKVFGFAATLIGSITAYYFGGKSTVITANAPRKAKVDNKPPDTNDV
jgi:hypothetical protein